MKWRVRLIMARATFREFSKKQKLALSFWMPNSPYKDKTAIICDGAVRSGKTLCLSLSFALWSMANFNGQSFALCGKTVGALRRNVTNSLCANLKKMGFGVREKLSSSYIEISYGKVKNTYYLFSGKDEGSASLIQGITLAGAYFDEVVLMPRSFTEQALARCSVLGSKFFFNCNPESPYHWFYEEWIKKQKEKNALYIHFTMDDNPSLSEEVKNRYKTLYSGSFFDRFVLGKWTRSEGAVYPMFDISKHVFRETEEALEGGSYFLSCDYGTRNPFSLGLWLKNSEGYFRLDERYYDSKKEKSQKTDEEYYQMVRELAGERKIEKIIVDPSASSFIETIKRHGEILVQKANNDVLLGIKRVQECLKNGKIHIGENCRDCLREFSLYRWNEEAQRDCVIKENDHAMDDLRYFVMAMERENEEEKKPCPFAFGSVRR